MTTKKYLCIRPKKNVVVEANCKQALQNQGIRHSKLGSAKVDQELEVYYAGWCSACGSGSGGRDSPVGNFFDSEAGVDEKTLIQAAL